MTDNNAYQRVLTAKVDPREGARPVALPMKNDIKLRIGSICCTLRCQHTDDCRNLMKLKRLYHDFLTKQPADITVDLEGTDRLSPEDLNTALNDNEYFHEENIFHSTTQIVSGKYDLTRGYIKITGERGLANPDAEGNHLNRLLSLAYYSACKMKYGDRPPAMIVHACGILRSKHAVIFTGPSDAGKTTIAHLCGRRDGEVINDEMVLVERPNQNGNGIIVESGPFLGGFPSRRNVKALLRCVFYLKQGNKTSARRLDRSEAYLKFMRQIITPAYIGQKNKRAVLSLMSEFSDEVTRAVPFYELEFNLDEKLLWQTVGELDR
jgi:hypothetical protein